MKHPDFRTRYLFSQLWHRAQKAKNIERMEQLLQPKFLNLWWQCYLGAQHEAGMVQWRSTCLAAITQILERLNLVTPRPPRPSEIAMARAEMNQPQRRIGARYIP